MVASGQATARRRLHGHTIVFPQKASYEGCGSFDEAVLQAALGQLRIYLVGPSGQRGQLERAALQVPDVRLRPEVVYNFLKIRSVVQGGAPPPDLAALTALIEPPGRPSAVERHVRATARMTSPAAESAERAAAGSDVANVRVGAQSDAHARVAGYEEAHAEAPPQMDAIGVLSVQEQEMEAVLTGISELVRTTGDGDGNGGGDGNGADVARDADGDADGAGADGGGDAAAAAAAGAGADGAGGAVGGLELARGARPHDDYDAGADATLDAWWPHFILGRGLDVHSGACPRV